MSVLERTKMKTVLVVLVTGRFHGFFDGTFARRTFPRQDVPRQDFSQTLCLMSGNVIRWIKNWLTDSKQRVV